jgi:hypothetical protein
MKKLTNILMIPAMLACVGLSSCMKEFNPKSYAPPLSIGGYTSTSQVAKANLVGYWSFNGNVVDSVSNTAGTAVGTSFTGGVVGQALQGANNSYVVSATPAAIQNLTSFTFTSWVHSPQNTNGIVGIMDIAHADNFWGNLTVFWENGGTATSGNLKIHVNNNGVDAWLGNYAVADPWDKWINIAVSYDETSSTFKIYINGSILATKTQAGYGPLHFQLASNMVFGTVQFQTNPSLTSATTSQPWASYLTGQLDEVRIYNKALSDNDVSAIVKLEGRGK